MNKSELIERVAAEAGLTRDQARAALDSILGNVEKALKKGDRVALAGFGTFSATGRAARVGRNPQTGKAIRIPAGRMIRFSSGSSLKRHLDAGHRESSRTNGGNAFTEMLLQISRHY